MDCHILQDDSQRKRYEDWENNEEIQIFREYLRIPTVHPNINYQPCITFLKRLSEEIGLELKIVYPVMESKPVIILSWYGTEPELKSILLNSHMDVVPVFEEYWTSGPFDANMDYNGRIYARGSQDMKCVGMQYLGAIRYWKKRNISFKRTIHVVFVPEEEIGGVDGMQDFIHMREFRALNVGFSLDEGIASPTDVFNVYYAERCIWHVLFKINGTPGHGSLLLKNTAAEKMRYILDKFLSYRVSQVTKLESDPNLTIGDVTTVNITQLSGGVQSNVVPPQFQMMTDLRLAIDVDHTEFENMFKKWCEEAGNDIEYEFDYKDGYIAPTNIDDSNIFWTAFNEGTRECGIETKVQVFPGGTDSRFIRGLGIPAIGFSPMNNTPILLHDHDEYLQADVYLEGIEIYKILIQKVADSV